VTYAIVAILFAPFGATLARLRATGATTEAPMIATQVSATAATQTHSLDVGGVQIIATSATDPALQIAIRVSATAATRTHSPVVRSAQIIATSATCLVLQIATQASARNATPTTKSVVHLVLSIAVHATSQVLICVTLVMLASCLGTTAYANLVRHIAPDVLSRDVTRVISFTGESTEDACFQHSI